MSSGRLSNAGTFSLTYNLPYWFYKFVRKHPMGEISKSAQTRLAMIEFYYQVRDVAVTARTFKTSRKTFYKWLTRFEENGKQLSSLEDAIKAPKKKRGVELTFEEEIN